MGIFITVITFQQVVKLTEVSRNYVFIQLIIEINRSTYWWRGESESVSSSEQSKQIFTVMFQDYGSPSIQIQ